MASPADTDRPMGLSILRGFSRRCPHCGKGHLFSGYLKVADACEICGEDFTPQRADDGPAYLTILVVGHLMAPFILFAFTQWRPDPLMMALTLSAGCVALSLFLLPRLKGLVIAVQWARCMHGFSATIDAR